MPKQIKGLFNRAITVRFDKSEMARLIVAANKNKTSKGQIIRQAVTEFLDKG